MKFLEGNNSVLIDHPKVKGYKEARIDLEQISSSSSDARVYKIKKILEFEDGELEIELGD